MRCEVKGVVQSADRPRLRSRDLWSVEDEEENEAHAYITDHGSRITF